MLENRAMEKLTITERLQTYLPNYIDILRNEFAFSEGSTYINKYLDVLNEIMFNDNNTNNFSILPNYLDELRNELDLSVEDNDHESIVNSIISLFVSKYILKLQPFFPEQNDENIKYDVFLSHCSWDAREVLGIKLLLRCDYGINAYVDWIDDKQANLPRAIKKIMNAIAPIANNVEKIDNLFNNTIITTGNEINDEFISKMLLSKIEASRSIYYVQSRHYDHSRWMPYELGYGEASEKVSFRFPIKYQRLRKKYGKNSGFLARYDSIIDNRGLFNEKSLI